MHAHSTSPKHSAQMLPTFTVDQTGTIISGPATVNPGDPFSIKGDYSGTLHAYTKVGNKYADMTTALVTSPEIVVGTLYMIRLDAPPGDYLISRSSPQSQKAWRRLTSTGDLHVGSGTGTIRPPVTI